MTCIDYKDKDRLEAECHDGRNLGFTGKQAIHPNQIDTIKRFFSPTKEELDKSRRIVDAWNLHSENGIGAFELDGKVVDMPVLKRAKNVLKIEQLRKILDTE